jgi:polyribonucleotide nucleotidyltransferase
VLYLNNIYKIYNAIPLLFCAPFSTGQTGQTGRPGRREIGHGALAEKLVGYPSIEDLPYVIFNLEVYPKWFVFMASTCGSTMSLMDAGVPIKDKV